jgi:uncharacterized protein (DUF362 family)
MNPRSAFRAALSSIGAVLVLAGCPKHGPNEGDAGPVASAVVDAGPDVDLATHASEPYEAGAPVLSAGVVDGNALRARHRARLAADRSPVTVLAGGTPEELGRRLCEATIPTRPKDTPILLKPNIGGFDWFKPSGPDDGVKGRITDPEFVRGVLRCLKARGHTKVVVAEGWGATHKDWVKLAEVSGYAAMTKAEGVPLVAMDDDGTFDVEGDTPGKPLTVKGMEKTGVPTLMTPKILAEALDHGLFVSLPKIKAHRFAVFSLGIKGTQGTIDLSDAAPAFRQKWRMHRELNPWLEAKKKGLPEDRAAYVKALEIFAERIADVLEIHTPDVVLAEGAPAMGGDGFQKLVPSTEPYAVGGTNVVLVDRVAAELLGFWDNADLAKELGGHSTSPLLEAAARRFGIDLAAPAVEGDGRSLLAAPRPVDFDAMASFSIHTGTRSAPATTHEAHAVALGGDALTIDGDASEPAWARAAAQTVTWDTDWSGKKTGIVTHARFLWSATALHALFESDGAGLDADPTPRKDVDRPKLWAEDCVELFVGADPKEPRRYWEIELGPYGHFLDLAVDRTVTPPKSDVAWSSGVVVATKTDAVARTSTIEAKIPAKELTAALVANAHLPFALYRMEGKRPRTYLAWSPTRTPKPDFHVPSAFGVLVVDPP